tara:strand:+ start:1492 stop:2763 length:1272 start_codon:yes stop_codon:yes gene_type:complete
MGGILGGPKDIPGHSFSHDSSKAAPGNAMPAPKAALPSTPPVLKSVAGPDGEFDPTVMTTTHNGQLNKPDVAIAPADDSAEQITAFPFLSLASGAAPELDRLAHGMAKTARPGSVVRDVAGALHSGGDRAKAEVRYLLSQLDRLAPTQAKGLRDGLTNAFRDSPRFLGGAFPEHDTSHTGTDTVQKDTDGSRGQGGNFKSLVNPKSAAGGGIEGDLPPEGIPGRDLASQGDIGRAYGRRRDATLILTDPDARGINAETDRMIDALTKNGVAVTTMQLRRPPINSRLVDPYKAGQVLGRIASGDLKIPAPAKEPNGMLNAGLVLHIGGAQVDQRTAYHMTQASAATPETLKEFQRSISEKNAPYLDARQRAQLNLWAQGVASGTGLRDRDVARTLSDNDAPGVRQRKFSDALGGGAGGKKSRLH